MQLTRERQEAARAFILGRARPLERALYAHVFEGADAGGALDALATYQNADGGFGHGIEPDLRTPASSVYATSVALQMLRDTKTPATHPLVERAMAYLLATYDAAGEVWPIIPPAANDAPHAPWWTWSETLAENCGGFRANPRAEIVGYLYDYAALVPQELRARLTDAVVTHAEALPDAMEMHDLLCYLRLVETRTLPDAARERLRERLTRAVRATVVFDAEAWGGYGLMPLDAAPSPNAAFASEVRDAVERNLDYAIAQQADDGSWSPAWSWEDAYPDAWAAARVEWQGVLTLKTLRSLRDWGRFE
ncbi:MAG: hypothetical protein ACXWP6_00065 [Ktedonobacterales bacterium]